MSNVLTVVFDKAEQKLDSVIAAAVNELHNLGHTVKEVRVMGDSGEARVALNTIEGVVKEVAGDSGGGATPTTAAPVADTVANKNPDGTSPVNVGSLEPDATEATAQVPEDTPTTASAPVAQTVEERRAELLSELEALDKEETADPTETAPPPADPLTY